MCGIELSSEDSTFHDSTQIMGLYSSNVPKCKINLELKKILHLTLIGSGGGTQYKSGYRDVPQTWVAKSGRQVHQWVPFFFKNMVL